MIIIEAGLPSNRHSQSETYWIFFANGSDHHRNCLPEMGAIGANRQKQAA